MTKKEVIHHLEQIALYLELKNENVFVVSAYKKCALAIENLEIPLEEVTDFTTIPGIGKKTAAVIEEFMKTNDSTVLQELKQQVPAGLVQLLKIQGLGAKKIAKLYKELAIENLEQLKTACEEKKVQALAGFGKKTEEKLLIEMDRLNTRPDRLPIAHMLKVAEEIEKQLINIPDIIRFSRAGSLRRVKETIKDLDFIIATNDSSMVSNELKNLKGVKEIVVAGETKVTLLIEGEYDVSVDFRMVKEEEFATTLHHFTGSKDHNVKMRSLAKERDEKISEYGVENTITNEVKTFQTEEEFYAYFDLPAFPPEVRETGIEVTQKDLIKNLIKLEDIKGDLHMHTTSSDGAYSLEEMIQAAISKGYEYMAITDHGKYLKVANGLSIERLLKQIEEIERLRPKYPEITILAGIEMDILPDGTLDYTDEVLSQLDFVIASIHSGFSQSEELIMQRIRVAMENPYVTMFAHPTGRIIGRRDGYKVNIDELIDLAKETNTFLEINSNPQRLDLSAEFAKKAASKGVKLIINTDAHHIDHLDFMTLGVSTAIKGFVTKEMIVNSYTKKQFLELIKQKRK